MQPAVLQAGGADSGHSALHIPRELSRLKQLPGDARRTGRYRKDVSRSGRAQQARPSRIQRADSQPFGSGAYC